MGQLSDAIREHLELQRRHGVPDEEISKQEAEALGPVRREPDAVSPVSDEDTEPASSFDAETALIGSAGRAYEEPSELEEPEWEPLGYEDSLEQEEEEDGELVDPVGRDRADPSSVFPEPDPTVPDERMSAEDPPPVGPRAFVDEAPVVHDEPLAEDAGEEFAGPPRERELAPEPPLEEPDEVRPDYREEYPHVAEGPPPAEEPQALPFGPDAEPAGATEPDPFATQPYTLPGLEEDEPSDVGPALLDEDELEAFEEGGDELPAGAAVAAFEEEEEEEPPLEEDTPGAFAYEDPVEDDADFDAEEETPRATLAPPPAPPRDSEGFDFDA